MFRSGLAQLVASLSLLLLVPSTPAQADGTSNVTKSAEPTQPAEDETREPADPDQPPHEGVEEIVVRSGRSAGLLFDNDVVEKQTIDRLALQNMPATNVADALRNLPGIRIQQRVQGQQAAVSIEGLPASYTLILLDGQRYSGEIGSVGDLRDIPLANVERIEVVRAAQGLRYGPEGGGGVINIITRPAPRSGASALGMGGGGTDQNGQADLTVGYGNEDIGGSLTFDFDQIGGFEAPDGDVPTEESEAGVLVPFGDLRRSYDLYGKIDWTPLDQLEVRTRVGWRQRTENFLGEDSADSIQRTYQRWLFSEQLEYWLGEKTVLETTFTYFNATAKTEVGRTYRLTDDEARLEASLEQIIDLGPVATEWALGADLRSTGLNLENEPGEAEIANPALLVPPIQERRYTAGLYLVGLIDLTPNLQIDAGLRYQMTSGYSPFILGHAALMWTPWTGDNGETIRLRASYGRNNRIPSLRDLYQPPAPNLGGAYFLAGNPDLAVETANSYRLGIEIEPVAWASISATGFYNQIQDHIRSGLSGNIVIGQVLIPADPAACALSPFFPEYAVFCDDQLIDRTSALYRKQNLDNVTTRGVEARLRLTDRRFVNLELGYTFLDTVVNDSNLLAKELPNEARHVVDASLTLTAPITETAITGRMRWRGPALIEQSGTGLLSFVTNDYSQSSMVVDVRVVQPVWGSVQVFFDAYNVTDNRIVDSYVVRGRSYFAGLRFQFEQ